MLKHKYGQTRKVILFTNARDEKNIVEWASHHLLIGFDNIIIFDHKSNTPLTTVFKNFDPRVKIVDVSNLTTSAVKLTLMNKAAAMAKLMGSDFMLYLDADEFLILNDKFIGIKHFLNSYPSSHSIGVNWLMFGSNNLIKEPAEGILKSYIKSCEVLNPHVKSFVRPKEIIDATNPHFYNIRNSSRMVGVGGRQIIGDKAFNDNYTIPFANARAYIAHYVNQSEETFIRRKCLLPADDTGRFRNEMRNQNVTHIHSEYNNVINLYPKQKYSDNITLFMSQYGK
jgi:hypothetical protein